MKNKFTILAILMLFTILNIALGEIQSYTNVYVGTDGSNHTRISTVATLFYTDDYEDVIDSGIESDTVLMTYQMSDLNQSSFADVNFVNVTCTFSNAIYTSDGHYQGDNTSIIHSASYDIYNTPVTFVYVTLTNFGIDDSVQCIFITRYNNSDPAYFDYPYAEAFIIPQKNTNLYKFISDKVELLKITQSLETVEEVKNQITSMTQQVVSNVFEMWLILFWLVKIMFLYVAFILFILAIGFPIFLLVRVRDKIRGWLGLSKNNEVEM